MSAFTESIARLTTTVDGKRVFSKFLTWYRPTLDCIHENLPAPDSWKEETVKEKDTDGNEVEGIINSPVYENDVYAWVQSAIDNKSLGISRGRDNSGNDVPGDWAALIETSGGSTYMAQKKVWREGYLAYLKSKDFSEKKCKTYMTYLDVKVILALDETRKTAVVGMLNSYEESLTDEEKHGVSSVLTSFANALSVEAQAEEF